jgi:hypothetical protein
MVLSMEQRRRAGPEEGKREEQERGELRQRLG